ncbi:MAG: NAD(P)(+) transhydrogenase (Re/Si-specific) subunit alpha, partial [Clostridiales bacterium]
YAADIRPAAAEQAKSLGAKLIEVGVPEEIAVGQGGYANALSADWIEKEREVLKTVVPKMDIIFGSALVPGKLAPILITDEMVASMAPGSVIVDISIDQGGNCASTVPGEQATVHDVIIEGIKNIPGMLPTSSTWMFAHNVYNLTKFLTKNGHVALDMNDEIVQRILVTLNGEIVHVGAKEAMGL